MQVSRAISKLIKSKLLLQQTSDKDKRKNLLRLAKKGNDIYQEIIPLVKTQEAKLLKGLTEDECAQLRLLAAKLSAQLQQQSVK